MSHQAAASAGAVAGRGPGAGAAGLGAGTSVPGTCRRDANRQADVEAATVASAAQDGAARPLALRITTLGRASLQNDQAGLRQRRQAEASPRAQTTPASAETWPHTQDRRDGAFSMPSRGAHGGEK